MTEREMLELAAKAAGIEGRYASLYDFPEWMTVHDGEGIYYTSSQAWNPLTDDGDALRLAVKLGLSIDIDLGIKETITKTTNWNSFCAEHYYDPYAATRRAIVHAAIAAAEGKA